LLEGLQFLEKKLSQTPPAAGRTFVSRRKDIYIGNEVPACRVGFLFPGQGAQLLNMGKALVDRHDWAQELVDSASEWLADAGSPHVVKAIFRPLERVKGSQEIRKWQNLLKQTETAQPAICLASLLWLEKLSRLGIRPDVVAGHSLGELTAFQAAGVFDKETLIRFALFRGRAMAASAKQRGTMASLACPIETATEIIDSINGYVVIANINSPEQTVISGEKKSVAEAVKLAKGRNITTHPLRTSNAFHSKFAQNAADLLRTCTLIPRTAGSLAVKTFSGINGMEILPGHNLPDHFADQAITPVNFISLIEAMANECDLMVEVGPGKILSRLTQHIILEHSPVCLPVEAEPGRYRDFHTVLANYFVRGGIIDWETFFADRLIRPFTPAAELRFIESPCERPFKSPSMLKQFDAGAAEIIESALTNAIDISPPELAEYLRLRGNFLESIIKSDIENLPQFRVQAAPVSQSGTTVSSSDQVEFSPPVKQQGITRSRSKESIEDLLYELIEKRTGFPRQTLSPGLRLLDDLNLDSIKAGDLLAEIAIQVRMAGDIDVSRYANAMLQEIIDAFGSPGADNMAHQNTDSFSKTAGNTEAILTIVVQNTAELTGRSVASVRAEDLLGRDLRLSMEQCRELIQRISRELEIELNVDLPPLLDRSLNQIADIVKRILYHRQARQTPPPVIAHRPWVREIHGQLIETPAVLPKIRSGKRYGDKWQHARVLLLGSEIDGDITTALQGHLQSLGAEVTLHALHKDLEPDSLKKTAAYSHLILLLPQAGEEVNRDDVWLEKLVTSLASIASPPPAAAVPRRRTTVAYIQFGGGRFGMLPSAGYLNRCCASALAKSLHLERDDLRVRVLDFDPVLPALKIAKTATGELHTPEEFAAVGYDRDLTRRELKQRLLSPAEYQDRPFSWSKEDVILVTGGAKGITAACALGVSRTTGARMALLGRSPHPDDQPESEGNAQVASTLKKYAEAGLEARYYCCDVSDRDAVNKTVRQIRATMGPITGVIHGAGLNVPRLISQVSIQEALLEVSPKVLGIINLIAELRNAPPRLFVGLSSIIGVTGMPGNGWYGFSNETLDVLLNRIEADFPPTKALSIAFSIWREEGMGVRMGSVSGLKQKGIDSIPTEEGVKRFTRLFVRDPGVHQVIIAARLGGLDTWQWQAQIPTPRGRFLEEPLHITPGVESVFQAHLSLETDPYLKDHVFNGSYLFPTVFGLEAMAQAVAHVTGQYEFGRVRIENIQLKHPITVDPDSGADIVVWAELAEPESLSALQTVHAGVYKQGAGRSSDYFSATFVLGLADESVKYDIDLSAAPLDIQPTLDLYNGKLLFQGPLFQRLRHIYALDSQKCIFDSEFHPANHNSNQEQWLLGDPYFRDSLLHSTQLPVSQHICLPVTIESIECYYTKDKTSGCMHGVTTINNRTDEEVHGSVVTTDENGQVVERISGYVLKIMEHHAEYPNPEEIADPGNRDEMIIEGEIKKRTALFGIDMPRISVTYLPGIKRLTKEERHYKEASILKRATEQVLGENKKKEQEINITWLESGKPALNGKAFNNYAISLSHNQGTIVSAVGKGPQGCDIESITSRTREEWIALLGKRRASLLDELVDNSGSLDRAGTRIWSAMETVFKAFGSRNIDLQIERREGNNVLFRARGSGDDNISIVTFPVTLTRGPERMLAVTAKPHNKQVVSTLFLGKESHAEYLNFDMESYRVQIENGPQDQPVFHFHFPITFKEASNKSKSLYFSNYFVWLGKLREYVALPIYDKLVVSFSTGNWGMVTNHAETRIFGEARSGDVIEGRLWLDNISGKEESTLDFIFEWRKINSREEDELIAVSTMSTTWVSIHGHGIVEVAPLPEFGKVFVKKLLARAPSKETSATVADSISPRPDFGKELFSEPAGPVRSTALFKEKVFETCLEDSNLVGNIYFSNYYIWQGRVRDHFLYEIVPEYFTDSRKQGELRCVHCEINHLSEAMPYDPIVVRMYRSTVYEKGFRFYFEYLKISTDGKREKLGHGVHEAIWHVPTSDRQKWAPSRLPREILDAVIPKDEPEVPSIKPKHLTKNNNKYDVIVVGAGIGGLTAAGLLAKRGKNVLIIEQHEKPGGFCTSFERLVNYKNRQLRYVFDAGAHDIFGLGPKGNVRRLIEDMGIERHIDWRRVDHQYIFPDLQIKVPPNIDEYVNLLCKLFPKEQKGLAFFFDEIQQCYSEYFTQSSIRPKLSRWSGATFYQMLNSFIRDQKLKKLLSVLCFYLTDDATNVKSATMIPMFGYYIDGGHYPLGGSQVFPNLLTNAIKEYGGDILLDMAVSQIIIDNNTINGVELVNGHKVQSEFVISNADILRTFSKLINPNHLPAHFLNQIKKLKPSNSAFLVFLGVDFIPDIEPVTTLIEENEHLIIMIPSKIDPSLVPPGHAAITLMRLIPNEQAVTWKRDDKRYVSRKEVMGNELISFAEKAIPNLHKQIIYREYASPATFARYAWTSDGAIYGTRVDEWKPAVKTPVQGLYLASASISVRPSVADAVNAGTLASNAILTQKGHVYV
jgi:enediyne polyketide synthase